MNADAPAESLAVVDPQMAADMALVERMSRTELWQKLDAFEAQAEQLPQTKMPLNHIFTHGTDGKVNFCLRECFNPKGAWITTRIHMKEHVFI